MGTLLPLGSVYCPRQNWFPHSLTLPLCAYYPPGLLAPNHSSLAMQGDIIHSLNEHAIYGTHSHTDIHTVVPGCTAASEAAHCQIVEQRDSQSWGSNSFLPLFFFLYIRKCLLLPPPPLTSKSWSYGKICELGISPSAHLLAMDTPEQELPPTAHGASVRSVQTLAHPIPPLL